jgi:putative FmdB family regulatory protein
MPTYAYVCEKCHHECEAFQSIKAKPLRQCPACGENTLKRLIGTGAGIIFKGSGFYCTDYRSDSYKNAAQSETGGAKDKATGKKEAKSENAAAPAPSESTATKKKSA